MIPIDQIPSRIAKVLADRNWQLISPNNRSSWQGFVREIIDLIGERVVNDQLLNRAITFAYCPILLVACREEGSERQERAFTELWQWIYPRVYARINHVQDAKDVAQKVLMRVYQNLHRVEKPHGFLGYVSVIIRHEVIDYYRRNGRLDEFEQEMSGKNGDNGDDDGMDDLVGPDYFLKAEIRAAEEELIRMIYACMPKKKWRRAKALVALTLLEQTAAEVAESLEITANAVYLLYFQAKKDLPKHCPELIEFLLGQLTPSQRLSLKEGNS